MFIVNVEGAIKKDGKWLIIERSHKEDHAAGLLSLVGGKVDLKGNSGDILERTLVREIFEEVDVRVEESMEYVHSTSFVTDKGDPVVDVVFLCTYDSGIAIPKSRDEVEEVHWMTTEEIMSHPNAPSYLRESILRAEKVSG